MVPARLRDQFSQEGSEAMVITLNPEESDPCLLVYSQIEWHKVLEQLVKLPTFNSAAQYIRRTMMGFASEVEFDGSGRVLIKPALRKRAQLGKKGVLLGVGNKLELWDADLLEAKQESWRESLGSEEMPEEVLQLQL